MMEFPELCIAYVAWGTGDKRRPALVLSDDGGIVSVYPVTSRYEGKSKAIQMQYFPITDWRYAGLDKPSYIDTIDIVELPHCAIFSRPPIGKLSAADEANLLEFLAR